MPTIGVHLIQHVPSQRAELEQAERPPTRDAGLSIEEPAPVGARDAHVHRHRGKQDDDERSEQRQQRRSDDQI